MKQNECNSDRAVRIILGSMFFLVALLGHFPPPIWGYIGLIPVATGFAGYCPLYTVFGWSTAHAK